MSRIPSLGLILVDDKKDDKFNELTKSLLVAGEEAEETPVPIADGSGTNRLGDGVDNEEAVEEALPAITFGGVVVTVVADVVFVDDKTTAPFCCCCCCLGGVILVTSA